MPTATAIPATSSAAVSPAAVEAKVQQQLRSQRVGYLLGAGSSYLDGLGYPLACELWDLVKPKLTDAAIRDQIQAKLDGGATGLENALDLVDPNDAQDTPHRHAVVSVVADLFMPLTPPLEVHMEFVRRLAARGEPGTKIYSLNYDPLVERAADHARVRLSDGFVGAETSYFDAAVFEERIGRIRNSHKGRLIDETTRPIHLLKLHGSLGWYECTTHGVRRCAYKASPPVNTRRLMVPPQRRKATDTMRPPYSALWTDFRASLSQVSHPLNRLACVGYAFTDEHVNDVIESALARSDFTLLILTKALGDVAWNRWRTRPNVVIATEARCSLKGQEGPGHPDLWRLSRLCKEI